MSQIEKFQAGLLSPANSAIPKRLSKVLELATRLPGADRAQEVFESVEAIALRELKARLDRLSPSDEPLPEDSAVMLAKRVHPRVLLSSLLEGAVEQDADAARRSLYNSMLLELTPDEAVLLATLSDEAEFALVNISVGTKLGVQKVVARNFCSIDRAAPVKLREYVPTYVGHLLALGLVEIGPEKPELDVKYQIVEGDRRVLALSKQLEQRHRSVKTQRRSLKISELGRDLWRYCDMDGVTDQN